ncbi:hypothetical protein XAP412_420044 [Xanthomonas phaseoli pv. phaseoli]|uniref:Uncharacterized protein n=1 Tax=Xanthomonas campestris pv. phaseoli TaxID=317013 RepID=A0AB38E1W3_XANCH|nr:hypothetical protein XAP6984_470044 [Xanthomonas phaseoli pv. phaseoli]SON85463.1 hypothetical protein XAP412_420044 [Xanthomonas phaseoli pv. phaseoli]SON90101.1 hypothetical protein XAP7430_440044 [Xanthomonas phaseoli pv. phaseoli]SOO28023.1 hypothetical protein XAP6164_2070013 [Xanthomonas phaseoli pv. phaseoli]
MSKSCISTIPLSAACRNWNEIAFVLMVGDTFEVYEVDRWGQAWVEKQWHQGEDLVDSHSLGLEPQQMLAVQDGA